MDSWKAEFTNTFQNRRVLVTGASGFIGWHICEALVTLGAEVHGLSLDACEATLVPGCKPWNIDLKDLELVRETVSIIKPQFVYHLAGRVTGRQDLDLVIPMLQDNLINTIHLLLAMVNIDCKGILIVSSSEEKGISTSGDAPTSPYAASKAAANIYSRMFGELYNLPIIVARLFMAYGPRQMPEKLIPYTILSFLRGESPHLSSGTRIVDLIYVLDVVRALLHSINKPHLVGGVIEIGTGQGTKIQDVVDLIATLTNSNMKAVVGTREYRIGERSHIAESEGIQKLEWEPRWNLHDGLSETITWYRSNMEID